jgi:hypothetical protein
VYNIEALRIRLGDMSSPAARIVKELGPTDPESVILERFKRNETEPSSEYSKSTREGLKKLIEKPAGR